jgi:hypothetical protein
MTSSTLTCTSSSIVECTPRSTKNWISCKNVVPQIVKTIHSFKQYWADKIALVNQTAVPALQHEYGMTTMDEDTSVALYDDSLMNFGAAFAAMKSQTDSLVAIQNQLANIQPCMNVDQQPLSSGYVPVQQQCTFTNHNKSNGGGQGNGHSFPLQPTMNYGGTGGGQQQNILLPIPTKVGRIGTTVTPMVVMLMTITPVQRVTNQVLCTTP